MQNEPLEVTLKVTEVFEKIYVLYLIGSYTLFVWTTR